MQQKRARGPLSRLWWVDGCCSRRVPPSAATCAAHPPALHIISLSQETFFGVLFYIYTNRWLPTDWRYVLLATVLQWVQLLVLFFGPHYGWDVDWQGNR